eukprot:3544860-Rhodomonas_salina.1
MACGAMCLRVCYAMSGTELAYAATRRSLSWPAASTALAYGAICLQHSVRCPAPPLPSSANPLRALRHALSPYAMPMPCPVLALSGSQRRREPDGHCPARTASIYGSKSDVSGGSAADFPDSAVEGRGAKSAICLRACYAMPGTDIAALCGTDTAISVLSYRVPGTDLAYAVWLLCGVRTLPGTGLAYTVLAERLRYWPSVCATERANAVLRPAFITQKDGKSEAFCSALGCAALHPNVPTSYLDPTQTLPSPYLAPT